MPDAVWEKVLNYGIAGIFAAVMIWLNVRASAEHRTDMKAMVQQWADGQADLQLVIKENTRAFTEMLGMLSEMRRQFDRWDGIERRDRRPKLGGG
jgi:hypothetical protein